MKKWFSITLGIVTAIGGFLDAGTIAILAILLLAFVVAIVSLPLQMISGG
jgi:hypothetical protein